jgi:hypothetical protein
MLEFYPLRLNSRSIPNHRPECPVLLAVDQEFAEGAIVGPPSSSAPSQARLAIPPTAVASSTD